MEDLKNVALTQDLAYLNHLFWRAHGFFEDANEAAAVEFWDGLLNVFHDQVLEESRREGTMEVVVPEEYLGWFATTMIRVDRKRGAVKFVPVPKDLAANALLNLVLRV